MTGSGTAEDPYIIYDVDDLQAMENDLTAYYELANDIDASATVGWNAGAGFEPIGDSVNRFTGQLDGKGYTIDSLTINRPVTSNVGLIGYRGNNIVLADVKMTNCSIVGENNVGCLAGGGVMGAGEITRCSSTGTVTGVNAVGGLIGFAGIDTIEYCWSSCTVAGTSYGIGGLGGNITNCAVKNCYATGSVTNSGSDSNVGGLIGTFSHGSILRSFATGEVSAPNCDNVSGLVGSVNVAQEDNPIQDCYARGAVTGDGRVAGLIGYIYRGNVDNCYSTGLVTGNTQVGGLIGYRRVPILTPDDCTNCFWDTETSNQAASDGGTGKTTVEMKTESTFTDAGWDFATIWYISPPINDGYPAFVPVVLPTATTNPATSVVADAATPNGTLADDGGMACDCGFEWGETIAYGNTTPTQSRTTGQTFAQTITGLDPGKTYHFRAFATNGAGTSYGADRTFTTLVAAPTVTTNPVTGRGMIIASFNGLLVADGGEPCECGFEWGTDITYGATTSTESKVTGEAFSQRILGLFPGTEYHYRAFATNSAGTSYGDDESFRSEPGFSRAYALAREEL